MITKKFYLIPIFVFSISTACSSTGATGANEVNGSAEVSGKPVSTNTAASRAPLYTGSNGKGLVIAVPAPSMSGANRVNDWMPQLFQDLITTDLSKYSAMTVLDRLNESMVLAEQRLSASGNYSDDDYIAMGKLTNARFIVAGTILGLSGHYSVSFRINNTETNEVKASFSGQYEAADIESGLAAKEATRELLAGMGVELSSEGERQLLAIQKNSVRSQLKLAQGMAAEKNNDLVDSLKYFLEARGADSKNREAAQHIQNFAQGAAGANIRERANWANTQKEKWEKIFDDLGNYAYDNLLIVVYDFGTITDKIDMKNNRVNITVTPGIKFFPNSEVLSVWKTVMDRWEEIKNLDENKIWVNTLSIKIHNEKYFFARNEIGPYYSYYANIELYDADGISIAQVRNDRKVQIKYEKNLQVLPQNRYFNNYTFRQVDFHNINISDITDDLSIKVGNIYYEYGHQKFTVPALVMSQAKWEAWLKSK